jgi:hypothetical protein
MRIRHSEMSGIEISGSEKELGQIAHALTRRGQSRFPAESAFDPAPYDEVLTALEISPSSGPTLVTVAEARVILGGAPEYLEQLATFFTSVTTDEHVHFEWFEGNSFVSRESIPLVITGARSGG